MTPLLPEALTAAPPALTDTVLVSTYSPLLPNLIAA